MGNRYLSSVLGDLRSGVERCKNLKETLSQFKADFPYVDEKLPKDVQKLIDISVASLESAMATTENISEMVEEVLNNE